MNLFMRGIRIFYEQMPQCGFTLGESKFQSTLRRLKGANETNFPAQQNQSVLLSDGFPQCPGRARLAVKPHLRDIKDGDGVHKCGGGFVLALQPII